MKPQEHLFIHLAQAQQQQQKRESYTNVIARSLKKRLAKAHEKKLLEQQELHLKEIREHRQALFELRKEVMKLETLLDKHSADNPRVQTLHKHLLSLKEQIKEKEKKMEKT